MRIVDFFKTKEKRKLSFSPNLYLGNSISSRKSERIKKKLLTGPHLTGVTLLVLSANASDQLDIIDAKQLIQPIYSQLECRVVGIASDYSEALELIVTIAEECLRKRGDCSIKEYLKW